jgi:hypothetical protein
MRRHPTQFPIRLALVLALILLAGAGATPASAGEYPVYACEPSQGDVNNSWQRTRTAGGSSSTSRAAAGPAPLVPGTRDS